MIKYDNALNNQPPKYPHALIWWFVKFSIVPCFPIDSFEVERIGSFFLGFFSVTHIADGAEHDCCSLLWFNH